MDKKAFESEVLFLAAAVGNFLRPDESFPPPTKHTILYMSGESCTFKKLLRGKVPSPPPPA